MGIIKSDYCGASMGLIQCTSKASLWRGYDYYEKKKVKNLQKIDDNGYVAEVEGTMSEPYRVHIVIDHPRESKCNCPHSDGKGIICKHMVATYFTAFPDEAQRIYDESVAYQEEAEKTENDMWNSVCHSVWHMSKSELQEAILELLIDGPEWQYDRFVRHHNIEDDYY